MKWDMEQLQTLIFITLKVFWNKKVTVQLKFWYPKTDRMLCVHTNVLTVHTRVLTVHTMIQRSVFVTADQALLGRFSVLYACSNNASDTFVVCIMSCDVSDFEKLRFCPPHWNDRPTISKVSTLESVFENLRFHR